MSTTKSNLQYPEADLDVRAYRATSSGVSWVGNPAFARYFSLAKVVCLHPEGIVETVAKREAFDDGTGVATKNHRLANRLFGSLNSIFYDTSVVDGDKQDEVVPFEDDDGVIRREKFRSKRSYDRIVYPTEDLWEVIAALIPVCVCRNSPLVVGLRLLKRIYRFTLVGENQELEKAKGERDLV